MEDDSCNIDWVTVSNQVDTSHSSSFTLSPAVLSKINTVIDNKIKIKRSNYPSDAEWNIYLENYASKIDAMKLNPKYSSAYWIAVLDNLSLGIRKLKVESSAIISQSFNTSTWKKTIGTYSSEVGPAPVLLQCNTQVAEGGACDPSEGSACLTNGGYFTCFTPPLEFSGKIIDEQGNSISGVTLDFHRGGDMGVEKTVFTDSNGNWNTKSYSINWLVWLHNKPGYYRGDITINTPGKQPDFTLTKLRPLSIIPAVLDLVRKKDAVAVFDLHNYDKENDVTNKNLEYCVSTNINPCTSFIDLATYTFSNGFAVRGPGRLSSKVTVSYAGFLDSNVTTASVSIRRKNDPSKIATVELQVKEASFMWNELVATYTQSGLHPKPLPEGVPLCPSGTLNQSSCAYLQHGSHCALDFNATSYKEFSCEIAVNTVNTVADIVPTAHFTVNGGKKDITVHAGDMVTKTWSSTNGSSYDAIWAAAGTCSDNGKTRQHWTGLDDLISPNSKAGGTNSYPASILQEGCNYVIMYTVTASNGKTASDYIIIRHPKPTINTTYTKTILTSSSDSLTFTVSGLDHDNAQGCLRVLAHPNTSVIISPDACTEPSQFKYFKDNPNWSFNDTTKVWTQTWSYTKVPSIFTS